MRDKHVAIVGFMGAGKTTLGEQAAARAGRPFLDLDQEIRRRATTLHVPVGVDEAWRRAEGTGRPLAQGRERFGELYEERRPLYEQVADAVARDADDVVLAAAGVHVESGALQRLGELVPGDVRIADEGHRAAAGDDCRA